MIMYRDPAYISLIQSRRWRNLRAEYIARHPLCERCEAEEVLRTAEEVHHIKPIEDAYTLADKRARAFDKDNLMSLCHQCHVALHKEMYKGTKKQCKERAAERVRGFSRIFFGEPPGG